MRRGLNLIRAQKKKKQKHSTAIYNCRSRTRLLPLFDVIALFNDTFGIISIVLVILYGKYYLYFFENLFIDGRLAVIGMKC